jgi:hypothetical protein
LSTLIGDADQWLYQAKAQGGNLTTSMNAAGSDTTAIHKLFLAD